MSEDKEVTEGLPPYSPEDYVELDMDDYRRRCPKSTEGLTDQRLYEIVAATDDDMDDEDWDKLFLKG